MREADIQAASDSTDLTGTMFELAKAALPEWERHGEDILGLRFLNAGDRFALLELCNAMRLEQNLQAIQLADRLLEAKVAGIVETLPMFVSVLIHYDFARAVARAAQGSGQDRLAGTL